MAKSGNILGAIKGFHRLYEDKKSKYSLRVDSLRKEMFYQNKLNLFNELHGAVLIALKFFNQKYKKKHSDEFLFYGQRICSSPDLQLCHSVYGNIQADKYLTLEPEQENYFLRVKLALGQKVAQVYKSSFKQSEKNIMFKYLLMEDHEFLSPIYKEFYKFRDKKTIIDNIISKRIYRLFYSTFDLGKVENQISKIQFSGLKNRLYRSFKMLGSLVGRLNFNMPDPPANPSVSGEQFANFGRSTSVATQNIIKTFNDVIEKVHPNLLPFVLSRGVYRFESEIQKVKKFLPESEDADLEKAMTDEMANIRKFFDEQVVRYRSLYLKSVRNAEHGIGVGKYLNDVMVTPYSLELSEEKLWAK